MTDTKTVKHPVKRVLKPVPDHGIQVQSSKTKNSDPFALPGSVPEPEIVRINTMAVPQPFLEPDKLEQWK